MDIAMPSFHSPLYVTLQNTKLLKPWCTCLHAAHHLIPSVLIDIMWFRMTRNACMSYTHVIINSCINLVWVLKLGPTSVWRNKARWTPAQRWNAKGRKWPSASERLGQKWTSCWAMPRNMSRHSERNLANVSDSWTSMRLATRFDRESESIHTAGSGKETLDECLAIRSPYT